MNFFFDIKVHTLALLATSATVSSCQHIDVAQITYEVLRAEDCRRNQLEDFCARTYASEYYDYVRLRKDFLRDQEQTRQLDQSNRLTLYNAPNTL